MTARRPLSTTKRVKLFEAAGGICHICGGKIYGKGWDVEHVIPLALGGADDASNMRPAHKDCHGTKTKADNASWSKAKRMKARDIGIRPPSKWRKPMPGSKASGWKKPFNKSAERRT
jgi:5-methylcytosine-specific restriction protein A